MTNPLSNCHRLAEDCRAEGSPFALVIDAILASTNSPGYLVGNLDMLLDAARLDLFEHQPPPTQTPPTVRRTEVRASGGEAIGHTIERNRRFFAYLTDGRLVGNCASAASAESAIEKYSRRAVEPPQPTQPRSDTMDDDLDLAIDAEELYHDLRRWLEDRLGEGAVDRIDDDLADLCNRAEEADRAALRQG
jgi:hypothetical protein